jgi:hypothetical protein
MTLPARSRRIAVALTQALVAALDVLSQLTPQASRLLIVVLPLTVLMLATAGTLIHDDAERTPPAAPVVVIPPSAWQKSPDHGASAPVAEPYGTIGEKRAVGTTVVTMPFLVGPTAFCPPDRSPAGGRLIPSSAWSLPTTSVACLTRPRQPGDTSRSSVRAARAAVGAVGAR